MCVLMPKHVRLCIYCEICSIKVSSLGKESFETNFTLGKDNKLQVLNKKHAFTYKSVLS